MSKKKKEVLIGILLFIHYMQILDALTLSCPSGWNKIYERCYSVFNTANSWSKSLENCQRYGGRLAEPAGIAVSGAVNNIISASSQNIQDSWIGYHRNGYTGSNDADGFWSDGTATSVEVGVWGDFEPLVANGNCVAINNGLWYMKSCDLLLPSVCELIPCPDDTFRCSNGRVCLGLQNVCNGEDDCGDLSDERNCPNFCTRYLYDDTGQDQTITYPAGSGNYPSSATCHWVLEGPPGTNIQVQAVQFQSEEDIDGLEFWEGEPYWPDGKCLAKISGELTEDYNVLISSNNFLTARFISDSSIERSGFSLLWRTSFKCQLTRFQNRRMTVPDLTQHADCNSACLDDVNCLGYMHDKNDNSCYKVPMFSRPLEDSCCDLYIKTCPWTTGFPVLTTFPNRGGTMQALSTDQQIFTPFYPSPYPAGQEVAWSIQTSGRNIVTLQVLDIELCDGDNIYIKDGNSILSDTIATLTSDSVAGEVIMSTRNGMYILMSFHQHLKCRGALLSFREGCDFLLTSDTDTFFTPAYGVKPYTEVIQCTWTIRSQLGINMKISFEHFDLPSTDFLQIYLGDNDQGSAVFSGDGYTGTQANPQVVEVPQGRAYAVFRSQSTNTRAGFKARYISACSEFSSSLTATKTGPLFAPEEVMVSCTDSGEFLQEPYTGSNFVTLQCQPDGQYDKTIPQCDKAYCSNYPYVENAFIKTATGVRGGGSVTLTCLTGYASSGSLTLTCNNDGSWDTPPTCTSVSCASLSSSLIGGSRTIVIGNGTSHGTVVKYTCNTYYELIGISTLACENGHWSNSVPFCARVKCKAPHIDNGVLDRMDPLFQGDRLQLACYSGYSLSGTNPFLCGVDTPPVCNNINECDDASTCKCPVGATSCSDGTCVDNDGGYSCSCATGYRYTSNYCQDIAECSAVSNLCHQTCVDSQGSYSCGCNSGYVLYTTGLQGMFPAAGQSGYEHWHDLYVRHSCVRFQCPSPLNLISSNQKAHDVVASSSYYYGDTLTMTCEIGYIIQGHSSATFDITCLQDGTWSAGQTCTAAKCARNPVFGTDVTPSDVEIGFNQRYTLTCNMPDGSVIYRYQVCAYDPVSNTYQLRGDNMVCPVVDCGAPEIVTGSSYSYTCTTYDCSFTFACRNDYRLAGFSQHADRVVRCQTNGRWDFSTLTCIGGTCDDPGAPPDGVRVNPVTATYPEETLATFACTRAGYTVSNPYPLKCEVCDITADSVLVWNATTPSCIDAQGPTFTNCPVNPVTVKRLEAPNFAEPTVSDNSGFVKSLTITTSNSKTNFFPSQVVIEDFTVTYTATDSVGNSEMCQVSIFLEDETPPYLTCVNSKEYVILNEDYSETINVSLTFVNAVEGGARVVASPSLILIGKDYIEVVQRAYLAAFDAAGLSSQCQVQVIAKAPLCQTWTLNVANADKTCNQKLNNGFQCAFTCQADHAFFEDADVDQVIYDCNPGSQWTRTPTLGSEEDTYLNLPQCRPYSKAEYRQLNILRYQVNGVTSLDENCATYYANNLNLQWDTLTSSLQSLCRDGSIYSYVVTEPSNQNEERLSVSIVVSSSTVYVYVSYLMEIQLTNNQDSDYLTCANKIKNAFNGVTVTVSSVNALPFSSADGFNCPSSVQATSVASTSVNGFVCDKFGGCEKQQYLSADDKTYCVQCPDSGNTGYNKVSATNWSKCPVGTYRNPTDYTNCLSCPFGTNSRLEGLATQDQCYLTCPLGMHSADGRAPCTECPINTYSDDGMTCTDCGSTQITRGTGKTLATDCIDPCPAGYYSHDGHFPCYECPQNYYQTLEGQTTCSACSSSEITANKASTLVSACILGSPQLCTTNSCFNGGSCNVIEHDIYCTCPHGYTGRYCENSNTACASSPCYNSGVCNSAIGSDTYTCICTGGSQFDPSRNCEDTSLTVKTVSHCSTVNLCNFGSSACDFTTGTTTCNQYGQLRRVCMCAPGFTGEKCDTNINECLSSPCVNGGSCTDGINSFSCNCLAGYTGAFCEGWDDVDVCSGACLSASCIDDYQDGTHLCTCENDHFYENGTCHQVNHCASNPCQNSGTCTNKYGGYFCTCSPGIAGRDCTRFVYECSSFPCLNGGTCQDGDNDYTCDCPAGTTGKNCDDIPDNCSPDPCHPDNTASACQELVNDYKCECKDGFYGKTCSDGAVNCNSYPCFHEATCVDHANGYTCNCPVGWTGADCGTEVDQCSLSPCENGAGCVNIVDDYICQCVHDYVGENCSLLNDPCSVGNPCANNGTCYVSNGLPQCNCPLGYQGAGCHVRTDSCSTTNCQNGATCDIVDLQAVCNCLPGYMGSQCQTNINECGSNPCPQNSVCVDGINSYACQCNSGLIGQNCDKPLTHDFDFIIGSDFGCGETDTYTDDSLFNLGSDALSISVWLRYTKVTNPGIIYSLYGLDQNKASTPTQLLQLGASSIQANIGSSSTTISLSFSQTINDGRWHHFVMTWNAKSATSGSGTTGRLVFYIDGSEVTERTNFGTNGQLPYYGWVVFGGEYDLSTNKVSKAQGMRGRMSRFFIIKSELSLSPDINALYRPEIVYVPNIVISEPVADMLENGRAIIDFNSELTAGKCLSTASSSSCVGIVDYSNYPSVLTCPGDQLSVTSKGQSQSWTAATAGAFSGATRVDANRVSGAAVLNWEVYGISYAGYDGDNNAAVCTFRLHNRETACSVEVKPDIPLFGSQSCVAISGSERCEISCPTGKYHDAAGPRYYTCGPYGMYGMYERQDKFVYTACADSTDLTYDASISATYELTPTTCDDTLTDTLISRVRESFTSISGKWRGDGKGLCGTACSQTSVTVECDSTNTKAHVMVNFPRILNPLLSTGDVSVQSQVYDVIMNEVGADTLDFTPNGQAVVRESVSVNLNPSCVDPFQVVGNYCVKCGQGYKYDSVTRTCIQCPVGQYQDEVGQVICKSCTPGYTTSTTGSQSPNDCLVSCPPGKSYSSETSGCQECEVGYYQPQRGQFSCIACGPGLTTYGPGTVTGCVDPDSITTSTTTLGDGVTGQSVIKEMSTAEIAAVVIGVLIIIVLIIFVLLFCFRNRLPCFEQEKIVPEDATPWKYVNRYGETNLTFVSYKLNDLRAKRGAKPLEKRPIITKIPEYSYTNEETGSVKTDISVHVPIFSEKVRQRSKKKHLTSNQVASHLDYDLPPVKVKRSKRGKRKHRKHRTPRDLEPEEMPVEMNGPAETRFPKPLRKLKSKTPSEGSFRTSSSYLHKQSAKPIEDNYLHPVPGDHSHEISPRYGAFPSSKDRSHVNSIAEKSHKTSSSRDYAEIPARHFANESSKINIDSDDDDMR